MIPHLGNRGQYRIQLRHVVSTLTLPGGHHFGRDSLSISAVNLATQPYDLPNIKKAGLFLCFIINTMPFIVV